MGEGWERPSGNGAKAGGAPCGRNPDFGLPVSSAVHQGPRRAARWKMEDSPLALGDEVANRFPVSTGDGRRGEWWRCWFCVRLPRALQLLNERTEEGGTVRAQAVEAILLPSPTLATAAPRSSIDV